MSIPIKTNQLEIELNCDAFAERFELFQIETSEKYFNRGAGILDAPALCGNVRSVFFDSGRCFYVLMAAPDKKSNMTRLKDILQAADGGDCITITALSPYNASERILVSLLLNALGSYENEILRFNNLTGHLYCFHPKWLRKRTRNGESQILKIPCLELAVTKENRLTISVRTFTSELLKNKMVFKKKKFEQYPKYVFAANHTLRRKLSTDTGKCFLLRQIEGRRTEIPFMDMQNLEKFEKSKMGILARVMELFHEKYRGICALKFHEIDQYDTVESKKALVSENKRTVKQLLTENKIKIVDTIGDPYSAKFCRDIQESLEKIYGVKAKTGKRLAKDCLNLRVIHNEAYYETEDKAEDNAGGKSRAENAEQGLTIHTGSVDPAGKVFAAGKVSHSRKHDGCIKGGEENRRGSADPHRKNFGEIAVQHVTLEDFKENIDAAIASAMQELLIKRDIVNRKISLFDWKSTGMTSEISFGMCIPFDEEKRFYFMRIRPDGTFTFEEQRPDPFSMNDYTDCVNIFTDSDNIAGVIRYDNGDINIIRETSWFTIPEIENIQKELRSGNTSLRGAEKRSELLTSITDIKVFDEGKAKYYFVGMIGEGMRPNVNCAANLRKIEPYKNAPLRFEQLLPLMNVTFVRNGQLTVLPFPFKYLREYIQSIGG